MAVDRSFPQWRYNRWTAQGDLQRNLDVPSDGIWQLVDGIWPIAITLGGTFLAMSADLLVANQKERPADSDNTYPAIYSFLAKGVFTITQPLGWIKLQVTSITGGIVTASYMASAGSTD